MDRVGPFGVGRVWGDVCGLDSILTSLPLFSPTVILDVILDVILEVILDVILDAVDVPGSLITRTTVDAVDLLLPISNTYSKM